MCLCVETPSWQEEFRGAETRFLAWQNLAVAHHWIQTVEPRIWNPAKRIHRYASMYRYANVFRNLSRWRNLESTDADLRGRVL